MCRTSLSIETSLVSSNNPELAHLTERVEASVDLQDSLGPHFEDVDPPDSESPARRRVTHQISPMGPTHREANRDAVFRYKLILGLEKKIWERRPEQRDELGKGFDAYDGIPGWVVKNELLVEDLRSSSKIPFAE
jgi:hypothetical protein